MVDIVAPVRAESLVDLLDDLGERFLVGLDPFAGAVEDRYDLAEGVGEGDGAFELLLDA